MDIKIDLKDCNDSKSILLKFGEALHLGKSKDWGENWDALKDSLLYLDSGGIFGDKPLFNFPLNLVFINSENLKKSDPASFKILEEILNDVENIYKEDKKQLTYTMVIGDK